MHTHNVNDLRPRLLLTSELACGTLTICILDVTIWPNTAQASSGYVITNDFLRNDQWLQATEILALDWLRGKQSVKFTVRALHVALLRP